MTEAPTSLADFAFTHALRVRWAELDPQRIVYNAHYLTYFDLGLTEYLRALGWKGMAGFAGHGTDIVLANANLDWRGSARHDDELLVGARIEHLGHSSFRFRMGCFRGAELLVEGRLAYVHVSLGAHRPQPLPAAFLDRVQAVERIPPSRKPG